MSRKTQIIYRFDLATLRTSEYGVLLGYITTEQLFRLVHLKTRQSKMRSEFFLTGRQLII